MPWRQDPLLVVHMAQFPLPVAILDDVISALHNILHRMRKYRYPRRQSEAKVATMGTTKTPHISDAYRVRLGKDSFSMTQV